MQVVAGVAGSAGIRALVDELARHYDAPHMEPAEIDRINQAVDITAPSPDRRAALEALLRRGRTRKALDRLAETLFGPRANRPGLPAIPQQVFTFLDEQALRAPRPMPDPGQSAGLPPGFTAQGAAASAWLAPYDVSWLAGAAEWADPWWAGTLHVGTPGDAEAGVPLLTLDDVDNYIFWSLADENKPQQVVVHRRIDGHAWAGRLGRAVCILARPAGRRWPRAGAGPVRHPV